MTSPALLALEDGTVFSGEAIGIPGKTTGEVVFNTAMTGYQEILTDPSYCQQLITLTYPHIGNTGVNREDEEATEIHASGLIIRDLPLRASNWRSEASLQEYLERRGVIAIADIDTRKLTRLLRDGGAQSGAIMAGDDVSQDDRQHWASDPCAHGSRLRRAASGSAGGSALGSGTCVAPGRRRPRRKL